MAEQTVSLLAQDARCEHFMLPPNGWVPNNTRLPVLVWRGAIDPHAADLAARFEALFAQNGWPPQWRDSVFDYHHFHSTAHEALGIASGDAELILGGPHVGRGVRPHPPDPPPHGRAALAAEAPGAVRPAARTGAGGGRGGRRR